LKHKLIDKRVLLKAFKLFLQSLRLHACTPVFQNFQMFVGYLLVVAVHEVSESKIRIRKFVGRQGFVVLDFKVASDWFSKLH
jgi:hypothetical protein